MLLIKCLSEECRKKHLEVVGQKGRCPYEYMNGFERFDKTKLKKTNFIIY